MKLNKKQLKKDLKTLPLETICTDYGLSFQELFDIADKELYTYMEEGDNYKYITKNKKGGYVVQKHMRGDSLYFGTYYSFDDALMVRDELIKENWDLDKLDEILLKLCVVRRTL